MVEMKAHKCGCGNCELKSSKAIFTARGKKTEFRLENNSRKIIDKYIVDDCLLRSNTREEKCDFLFDIKNDNVAYLIECKGSDILKAIRQIDSTINILKSNFSGYVLKGRIIPSRVNSPDIRTVAYKKLRERLNGNLTTKNMMLTEEV